jgi:3-methylcrotonyl-CoA carboxylase alpha subunit
VIRRLLIANRGEIALRIARGARELGIAPLGVYSDADEHALFREALDASVRIGPGPATESYLNGAAIIAAARELNADAIHPGYGFLSERAPFAQAVIDAELIFVGPTPAAIAAMGSKSEAKQRVRDAGVPVIDGYDGASQDDGDLLREAVALGVPLVIKAVAGGGGRGMRVVEDLATFPDLLLAARREALSAFGDGDVILERYVRRPRHIEFQILADHHGAMVHVGERDCSIQRRHQKVVEEAPSPVLDAALRARIGDAAIVAARSVGYTNAGTVEFLLDADGTFAFLEMNARLQVEHPVTELVYGIDLVHEQLRIASGEPLRHAQADLVPRGAAIEVRLNAEDPQHDYAPQAGTITAFEVPSGAGVRLDTGVRSGSTVPVYYDSLLAKIIAHGADRTTALAHLRDALAQATIAGIATNLPLLRAIANDDAFTAGDTTTGFLEERLTALTSFTLHQRDVALTAAAAALLQAGYGWRASGIGIPLDLVANGERVHMIAERTPAGWRLHGDIETTVPFDAETTALRDTGGITVIVNGTHHRFAFATSPSAKATHARVRAGSGDVSAPMPGKIVSVSVKPGDTVKMHDRLMILEAMKMEHRIDAPLTGTVSAVLVAEGDLVAAGAALVTIGAA